MLFLTSLKQFSLMFNKNIISVLFVSILTLSLFSYPRPAKALGFVFGGRITRAQYGICYIYYVPFPLVILTIKNASTNTTKDVVYLAYAFILQAFGVTSSLYNYYQLRSGPNALGQYLPIPIPWTRCTTSATPYPTNLLLKIGTSLY